MTRSQEAASLSFTHCGNLTPLMIGRGTFRTVTSIVTLAASATSTGCRRPPALAPSENRPQAEWFREVGSAAGLAFVHHAGPPPTNRYFMPQIMGSGAAIFDANLDGRLDVYFLQNAGPNSGATNKLFYQQADGRFHDVSAGSNLDIAGYGMGAAVGDVNNDGRPDLFVTEFGRIRLFLNGADGVFHDITRDAGMESPLWATSASFLDYDRDGWLDLVVVNYVDYDPARPCDSAGGEPDYCPPKEFLGTVSNLYRNEGSAGPAPTHFEDVTLKSGLGRAPGPGLGVVCADFDGDRWPDIFVANDEQPNRLWINRHDGTFVDEAPARGVAYNALGRAEAGMGIALGDVDGNGLADLFVTHLSEETHTLWTQRPTGIFQDFTAAAGLATPRWRGTGFGTALVDFDNDMSLDLAVANGRIRRPRAAQKKGEFFDAYAERNQLFLNDGRGQFRDISDENKSFCGNTSVARGLACADFDNDGGVDLLVTSVAGPAALYRNVVPKRGHWLLVRAFDPALQRDAYGARITVHAAGRHLVRWLNPASSYLCSNDPRAHFGLGQATAVENADVLWPDGTEEIYDGLSIDHSIALRKGEGKPATAVRRTENEVGAPKTGSR